MTTKKKIAGAAVLLLLVTIIMAYYRPESSHQQMLGILKVLREKFLKPDNSFNPEVKWANVDSLLKRPGNEKNLIMLLGRAALSRGGGGGGRAGRGYET